MSESVPESVPVAQVAASKNFTFVTESGATVVVPQFKKMPTGVARKMRNEPVANQVFAVLEYLASKEALAILDETEVGEFNTFIEAWQADSGITVGESSASSSS